MNTENENKIEELELSHEVFINEYMKDFNGTRAYLVAYPDSSPEAARTSASRLLTKDNIKHHISKKAEEIIQKTNIDISKVIKRYKEIAFADIRDVLSWDETGNVSIKPTIENGANIIESVQTNKDGSIKFKTYCALNALDSLSKYYGLFVDKKEIDLNAGLKIVYADKQDEQL